MTLRSLMIGATLFSGVMVTASAALGGQAGAEVFSATATVKFADGKSASRPVTITVNRKMPKSEAEGLVATFKSGGPAALRKALAAAPATGSVRVGTGNETTTQFTIERAVGDGRLLTIVSNEPLVFIGAAKPGAKPKAGYDFAVIDLQVDANGAGSGTIAPAAKLKLNGDALVVEDYGGEVVRLTAVKKTSK